MTRPDAITQEAAPCWVLRLPNGEQVDGGIWEDAHYDTQADAAKAARDEADDHDPPRALVPVQLDTPCWTAKTVCGEQYSGDGTFSVEHWPSRADLLDMVLYVGWKPVEGGGMTCGDDTCADCASLTVVRVRQEIPGQLAWEVPA